MTVFLTPPEELAQHLCKKGAYAVMFVPDGYKEWGEHCKAVMLWQETPTNLGAYELRYWNMFPVQRFSVTGGNYERTLDFVKDFTQKTPAVRFQFFFQHEIPIGQALIPYREAYLATLKID